MWYSAGAGAPAVARAAAAFLWPAPAPLSPAPPALQRAGTQPTTAASERFACARGQSSLHIIGRRVKRR
eukprot:scaffold16766_cov43-Phaeocystis_antarctica.AAC.1